jgi:hypothetical protein
LKDIDSYCGWKGTQKRKSTLIRGKNSVPLASFAVNIAFTKIVTDPAKSVKTGVELSAGNELFLKSCNQWERYPSEIIKFFFVHSKTHLYGTVFA